MAKRPTSHAKSPKRELQRPSADKSLQPDEATTLKGWAHRTFETSPEPLWVRNAAIVLVLLGTAARRFELCAFQCGDFVRAFGNPRAHFDEAKGNIEAEIDISEETWKTIVRWREIKVERGESIDAKAPLFCGRNREYLSIEQLHNIWKAALKAAGVSDEYGVHASRHTAGMLLLQATGSLTQVSEFMRHTSQDVTARFYKHVLPSDIRAGLTKAGL
jgi:integrase